MLQSCFVSCNLIVDLKLDTCHILFINYVSRKKYKFPRILFEDIVRRGVRLGRYTCTHKKNAPFVGAGVVTWDGLFLAGGWTGSRRRSRALASQSSDEDWTGQLQSGTRLVSPVGGWGSLRAVADWDLVLQQCICLRNFSQDGFFDSGFLLLPGKWPVSHRCSLIQLVFLSPHTAVSSKFNRWSFCHEPLKLVSNIVRLVLYTYVMLWRMAAVFSLLLALYFPSHLQ